MEKKLYIIKEDVLIAVMDVGTYSVAAPTGARFFNGTQTEFEALKQKEGIDTAQYDAANSENSEYIDYEEVSNG